MIFFNAIQTDLCAVNGTEVSVGDPIEEGVVVQPRQWLDAAVKLRHVVVQLKFKRFPALIICSSTMKIKLLPKKLTSLMLGEEWDLDRLDASDGSLFRASNFGLLSNRDTKISRATINLS